MTERTRRISGVIAPATICALVVVLELAKAGA